MSVKPGPLASGNAHITIPFLNLYISIAHACLSQEKNFGAALSRAPPTHPDYAALIDLSAACRKEGENFNILNPLPLAINLSPFAHRRLPMS
jgi:hypothetical protein